VLRRPLPADWSVAVDGHAGRLGTTRFPVVVAAFAAALREVLGQDDFGIGVPFSVRRYASQHDPITCLMDTVCLRLRPAAQEPLSKVALRAHEQMSLARGRHTLPFSDVVRAVNPARQHGRNPLFRTMFVLQDNDPPRLALVPATVELRRPELPEPMSELLVEVWPGPAGDRVDATFYSDTAPPETISALLEEFGHRLAQVVAPARAAVQTARRPVG
jgi:non-ribosomal peptide synthetase component F